MSDNGGSGASDKMSDEGDLHGDQQDSWSDEDLDLDQEEGEESMLEEEEGELFAQQPAPAPAHPSQRPAGAKVPDAPLLPGPACCFVYLCLGVRELSPDTARKGVLCALALALRISRALQRIAPLS